ncbi:MAG TPA: hypothetical protein VLK27_11920 [Chthoniobacterales bacterium]|nr:hypothetical protein [Chthoniobacterales bacterium]
MSTKTKIILTTLLGVAWAVAAVLGGHALLKYENSPGKVGNVSLAWPPNSSIQPDPEHATLVMFAHPQCPCSRASMDELAQIMARAQGKVRAYVLFYTPRDAGSDWQDTSTHRGAARIPGVTVLSDFDGVEAARFGAETSGHTLLFDQSGRLLFNGGITASRGHSGANTGENAIVSLIDHQIAKRNQTLVFGCAFKSQRSRDLKCLR